MSDAPLTSPNFAVDLWDATHGERVSFELPKPDGSTQKIVVTKKWMEQMVAQGKMTDVTSQMVKVNIIDQTSVPKSDPSDADAFLEGLRPSMRTEHWRIGSQITQDLYDRFVDSESGELYVLITKDGSGPTTAMIKRALWELARRSLDDV